MFGIGLYLHSVIESIDAVVIFVSFSIDVYLIVTESREREFLPHSIGNQLSALTTPEPDSIVEGVNSLPEAAGFLVVFRLWRVVRIINGKFT